MNVLVMSIANKIPMIKAIRTSISRYDASCKLYGADMNGDCLGRFFVDHFWNCPSLSELSLNQLINYCKKNQIKFIFLSRDGELDYFARIQKELHNNDIFVMVSKFDVVECCLDKLLFYQQLNKAGFPVIKTEANVFPGYEHYVIKERYGSGSQGVSLGVSFEEVITLRSNYESPIVQPQIIGKEYSIDVYASSQTNRAIGAIVRERVKIHNGESQITVSCKHDQLEKTCMDIVDRFSFRGHVMFQVLIDELGMIHIIECNARIGGASTLAIAMGLDSYYWFMSECEGKQVTANDFKRSAEEKTLIRHMEDHIH